MRQLEGSDKYGAISVYDVYMHCTFRFQLRFDIWKEY